MAQPQLTLLDPSLVTRIVEEARHILSQVGMEVRGAALRRRLLDHGLPESADGKRLLFPADVVMQAIASAPKQFTLYDRPGNAHSVLGGDRTHFVPGSSALRIRDHRTDAIRPATTQDFVEYVRLAHGLEHLSYLATAFSTEDVDPQIADAWRLYLCFSQSSKPVVSGAFTEHGVPRMAEMMLLLRRDRADLAARPLSIFTITPSGNLRFGDDSCQNLLDCAEWGIPMEIVPVTLMGLIAPVTLVGAAVFHTVDVLAGLTMAQLIRPGVPVLFGGAPATFHMHEATSAMMAVEALRLDVAYASVGKTLGLPIQAYMAFGDGKFLDAQAGAETFGSALLAVLAGVNSVSGPGMLDYQKTFSLSKLVFDDEACGQALFFGREAQEVEDLPSAELVAALLDEGHLLTAEHTLRHWARHLYLPGVVYDRQNWARWAQAGEPSLQQRAGAEVERRLAAFVLDALDPRLDAEMRRLIGSSQGTDRALPDLPPHQPRSSAAKPRARRSTRRSS